MFCHFIFIKLKFLKYILELKNKIICFRSIQTIESTETKSVTKSRYRGEPATTNYKYYERENRYNSSGASPVVIEVRNNYRR